MVSGILLVLLLVGAGAAQQGERPTEAQAPAGFPFPVEPGDIFANAPVGVLKLSPAAARPLFAPALGVTKTAPPAQPANYRIYSSTLAVHRGPGIDSIAPNRLAINAPAQAMTIHGHQLGQVVSVAMQPATGVSIASFVIAADGRSIDVVADVAADAAPGLRRLSLRDAAGKEVPDLKPLASAVLLLAGIPVIESVTPNLVSPGQSLSILIRGQNLRGIPTQREFTPEPRIQFTAATGLIIGNDVQSNAEGTQVSFTLSVAADAALVDRLVQVVTASGTSTATLSPSNTLRIAPGSLRSIGPFASQPLRIQRGDTAAVARTFHSVPVTVAKGPTITAMTPTFVNPGETIELILSGRELAGTSAVEFSPATGITAVAGSLTAAAEEIRLTIQLATDAPRIPRAVRAVIGSRRIDAPTLLDVRDAPPEITALTPKYLVRNGLSQVIEIQGLRLSRTDAAALVPNAGIVVETYQALSETRARLTLRAAVDAAVGPRLLRLSTPAASSSDVPDPFNTLLITDVAQIRTLFASPQLGIVKTANVPPPLVRILAAPAFGVVRGAHATSVSPAILPRGTSTAVSITGVGLDSVTALEIAAADGLNISALQSSGNGTLLTAQVNVAADAVSGMRGVRLRTAGGDVPFVPASAAAITIAANQPNAPTANPDTYIAIANSALQVGITEGVLSNDVDPENGVLYAVLRRLPAAGVLNLSSDGSFVYVPNADFAGTDRFEYSAGRGAVVGIATTVTINVREPNDAVNDFYQASDNQSLNVAASIGLLANDTRTTANPLLELDSQPTLGSVVVVPDGSFVYTPNGSAGTDRFRYRLIDGALRSLPAEVSIAVAAVNETPIAEDDFYAVDRNRTLNVSAPGVRSNDSDPDGDPLTLRIVADPPIGTLSLSNNGAFSYVPPANFVGQTQFVYEIMDPQGLHDQATVLITVNDRLAPQPDTYVMNEGEVLFVDAPGLLANDSYIPQGTLRIVVTQAPTFGTVQTANDGSFVYRPDDPERSGVVSFRYALQDNSITSSPAEVRITINGVNDPPHVVNERYLSDENAELIVPAPGVLEDAEDIDSASFTASLHAPPLHGVVTLRADGSFNYVPEVNFRGADTFQYRATDTQGATAVAMVTIDVTQPPTATNDVYLVDVDTPLIIDDPLEGLLINDHDAPERDPLTVLPGQDPEHGTLLLNANGTFEYVPDTGFSGIDTFTYQVTDGRSSSNIGNVTLAVGITSLPRAYPDEYEMTEDQELIVPAAEGVLANDTDADTPAAQLEAYLVGVGSPSFTPLDVTLNRDGSFRVRTPANFFGETFFAYQVYDGTDISNTAIVTITVLPVNDGVDAVDDHYSVRRNTVFQSGNRPLGANDRFDPDFAVRFEVVNPPDFGTVVVNALSGQIEYTPQADFSGLDTFTYRLFQVQTGVSDTATVTLRTNAAPTTRPDTYTVPEDATTTVSPSPLANDIDADGDVVFCFFVFCGLVAESTVSDT